ncbi:MAG: nucleotidyltransferase family protein [Rhabdochlamydiaceae bacterium]|jgi:predicted nucleotidyltransferase
MGKKKNKDSVLSIKKKAVPILKRHAVKRASIFGSFARGCAKPTSDIDFLIEYKGTDKSLFDLVDLKSDLEKSLHRKVDLVTYKSIYWGLRKRILAEQVVIL